MFNTETTYVVTVLLQELLLVSVDNEIVVTESVCPQVYKFQLNVIMQVIL